MFVFSPSSVRQLMQLSGATMPIVCAAANIVDDWEEIGVTKTRTRTGQMQHPEQTQYAARGTSLLIQFRGWSCLLGMPNTQSVNSLYASNPFPLVHIIQ